VRLAVRRRGCRSRSFSAATWKESLIIGAAVAVGMFLIYYF
jgi:hypothetical protein